MYNFLSKHSTSVAFGLGVLVSAIAMVSIFSGLGSFNALAEDDQGTTTIFNPGLMGSILLIGGAAIAMIGFGIYGLITNPKGGLRFLLGIVAVVLIGFLFYQYSEVETSGKVFEKIQEGELSPGISKVVNGALWSMIILIGAALVGLILSEIRNIFK